jgi:hypothetical protein
MPVIGRVVEVPAASGEATAEASEVPEPELAPPEPPLPPELTTRIVPFICGWIVQM